MSLRSKIQAAAIVAAVAGSCWFWATEFPVLAASGANASTQVATAAVNTEPRDPGGESYAKHCSICHGDQREGILPAFPPLLGIHRQMTDAQITELVRKGKGRMPGFPALPDAELISLLHFLDAAPAVTPTMAAAGNNRRGMQLTGEAAAGGALFQQNCAFCHGRDAMGGETGPDLTQSKLVLSDTDGSKTSTVVREGRNETDKKMPAFQFSNPELMSLVAFIRARVTAAATMKGGRRGVSVADLQTGNVAAGKEYFNGAGGCAKCHSPTGDLAGIARRYEGLRLEMQMLYPHDAKSTVVVTQANGEKIEGTLAYRDEFTIGLKDGNGMYHSWPVEKIHFKVNSPVDAHVEQFPKYTDDDIHNLMAYLQTLK